MTPCRRLPLAFISESIRIRLHFFHSLPHPIGRISYWSVFLVRSPRSLGRMLIRRGGEDGGTPKNSCVACFRSTIELGFARVTSRLFSRRGFHFRLISFHPDRFSFDRSGEEVFSIDEIRTGGEGGKFWAVLRGRGEEERKYRYANKMELNAIRVVWFT